MKSLNIRKMVYAAVYIAVGLLLPFITGQIPTIGVMLSPMHIPVLLCGFSLGGAWGMAVGAITPLLRSVLFQMPAMYPNAVSMAFELATYGLVSGLLYRKLPKKTGYIYVTLIVSMIVGRIVWGLARFVMAGLGSSTFSWEMFVSGAVTTALPGIILHIVIIPPLVVLLKKAGANLNS